MSEASGPWELLSRGVGTWEGEERMAPAPWAPDGVQSTGRTEARAILDGRGLASDYVQMVGGEVTASAHTVLRYDEEQDRFEMHFFGTDGAPAVLQGTARGEALVFEGEGPGGPMRQTFVFGDGEMEVRSEAPSEDAGWVSVFEGRYRRLAGPGPAPGSVAWQDLTVDDAEAVRDFYAAVVGWTPSPVSMGGYDDFNMCGADGAPLAGICHARGGNADLPPTWLLYVVVPDLDAALAEAEARGGERIIGVREMGPDRMAVIRDPAGAALALYQSGAAG